MAIGFSNGIRYRTDRVSVPDTVTVLQIARLIFDLTAPRPLRLPVGTMSLVTACTLRG